MIHNDGNQEDKREEKATFEVVEDGNAVKKENNRDKRPVREIIQPKNKKKEWVMPVLLTIITAGVIGTISGMFILNLFVGLDGEEVTQSEAQDSTSTATAEPNEPPEVISQELNSLSSYVLQAGVFTERENAEEWLGLYDDLGEQSLIWERENQYYLFIGIYGTEEQARSKVEELQANEIDVFMKEWETWRETTPELSEEEMNWLHHFQETWQEALASKDEQLLLDLVEHAPTSSTLEGLVDKLENPSEELDYFFLEIMKAYETF